MRWTHLVEVTWAGAVLPECLLPRGGVGVRGMGMK